MLRRRSQKTRPSQAPSQPPYAWCTFTPVLFCPHQCAIASRDGVPASLCGHCKIPSYEAYFHSKNTPFIIFFDRPFYPWRSAVRVCQTRSKTSSVTIHRNSPIDRYMPSSPHAAATRSRVCTDSCSITSHGSPSRWTRVISAPTCPLPNGRRLTPSLALTPIPLP